MKYKYINDRLFSFSADISLANHCGRYLLSLILGLFDTEPTIVL